MIAAALSIQDPRERPAEHQQAADEAHRRFATDGSDFLALVRLWDHLRERQQELGSSQFRKLCRAEYLNYLRVREWQDLYSQLRQIVGSLGIRMSPHGAPEPTGAPSTMTSHPDRVHQALMAGLLSHLGHRDGTSRDYRGAHGATFAIARGSSVGKQLPRWIMAAELVETNRLWARTVTAIQPEWAERIGAHLVRRSYGDATWDAAAGRGGHRRTGQPVRVADRQRTHDRSRSDRRPARSLDVHPPRAGRGRLDHAPHVHGRQPSGHRRSARARGTHPAERPGRRRCGARVLRRTGRARRGLVSTFRSLVEAAAAHLPRSAHDHPRHPARHHRPATSTRSPSCGTSATSCWACRTGSSPARPTTASRCTCRSPC